jgi:predicted nucleic acid-binding protein
LSAVLDNSVTARWLFKDGSADDLTYADKVLKAASNIEVVVPVTWGLEVANVIARGAALGQLTESRIDAYLILLRGLAISFDEKAVSQALTDTLDISRKYRLSSYDASYLEAALRLSLPIATLDKDLLRAAKKAGVSRFEA